MRESARAIPPSGLEIRHKLPPLKALTPLRFLAAIHVVLFHNHFQDAFRNRAIYNFIDSGYTGVTFFFVLSGFILAYNYQTIRDKFDFWVARFARIYPLYAASILVVVVFQMAFSHTRGLLPLLLFTMPMIQSWFGSWAFVLNSPAWTLSDEAFFYAVFPFVVPLCRKLGGRAGVVFAVLYLMLWSAPEVLHLANRGGGVALFMTNLLEGPLPILRLPSFLLGVFAGLFLVMGGKRSESVRRAVLSVGVLGVIALLCVSPSDLMRPAHSAALAIAYAALIYGAAYLSWPILVHPLSQLAGEISFGVYILQVPVERVVNHLPAALRLPEGPSHTLVFVPILVGISYVGYRFFEIPCRLFLRRVLTGKPVATRPL